MKEREREREREPSRVKTRGISVKRDLVWRQKRPSKDTNETRCRGKTSEHQSSMEAKEA